MTRPIVAVDVDDVLSSEADAVLEFSNQHYGTKLTRQDIQKPGQYWGYYESVLDPDKEIAMRRFLEFRDGVAKYQQVIDPAALVALQDLSRNYDIEIITSRDRTHIERTISWLQHELKELIKDIHFVDLWSDKLGKKATKAQICQEIGAGYLIDDSVEHCNLAAEAGITAILFGNYGWQKGLDLHPGVEHLHDWRTVLDYINERN